MQSTLASLMFFSFSWVAASSYSGASALQWPHHGAKTGGRGQSGSIVSIEEKAQRTLGEHKLVALDEVAEGVLGELLNVGSRGESGGAHEAEYNGLEVLHGGVLCN